MNDAQSAKFRQPAPTSRRAFVHPMRWGSALGAAAEFTRQPERKADDPLLRAGRPAMACEFEILWAASDRRKILAVHRALSEVQRLEAQMTVYRDDSELSILNRRASESAVPVERRLFDVLRLGAELHRKTRGAFDITSSPLSRCWGLLTRQGRVPQQKEIDAAFRLTGTQFLRLDPARRSVRFLRNGMELNLGSIGKGYALDRAAERCKTMELRDALLHAGHSSILAHGSAPSNGSRSREGWKISIRHPLARGRDFAVLNLSNRAMATSGSGEQYFESDGRRYGHVIDPRTGYPADGKLSATAFGGTAAKADALATAFFVMEPVEIEAYCRTDPDAGALIVPRPREAASLTYQVFGHVPESLEVFL